MFSYLCEAQWREPQAGDESLSRVLNLSRVMNRMSQLRDTPSTFTFLGPCAGLFQGQIDALGSDSWSGSVRSGSGSNVAVLEVLVLVLVDIFEFLHRKKRLDELSIMWRTQSIEVWVAHKMGDNLYNG